MTLGGKTAMVTGAAGAIGAAVAELFLAEGAQVCLADIDGPGAEDRARRLDPEGTRTLAVKIDVTDEGSVDAGVKDVVRRFRSVNVLVNSAGILKHLPIEDMSLEDFERVLRVNLVETFITCRAVVREMVKQGGGKIVNVASIGGRTGRLRTWRTRPSSWRPACRTG